MVQSPATILTRTVAPTRLPLFLNRPPAGRGAPAKLLAASRARLPTSARLNVPYTNTNVTMKKVCQSFTDFSSICLDGRGGQRGALRDVRTGIGPGFRVLPRGLSI